MYGELTNEHEFAGRFYNAPQAIGWDGQQYLPRNLRLEEFDVSEEGLELITRAVRWTVREFGRETVEEIKQHQYEEHSQTPFIQEYSDVRWLLQTIDLGSQQRLENYESGASNEQYLRRRLDGMLATYPGDEERYTDVKPLYLRWDDTVRLMLDQSVEYSRIAEFLDDFIRTLSETVLRFNYSRNISADRLRDWREDAAEERAAFATQLRDVRRDLFDERTRSTELDGVSDAYSQTVEEKIERLLASE